MWRYIRHFSTLIVIYGMTAAMLMIVSKPLPAHYPAGTVANQIATPRLTVPRPAIQGVPTHLAIPSLGIDLPVQTASFDPTTNTWPVDHSGAFFANASVPVNDNNGTSLIYAHAQSGLFETLPNIALDAEVIVTTDNGHRFHYSFASMQQVDPSYVGVFRVDGPPQLILQTCMGDWSQYRALFTFKLQSIEGVTT